ncbi:MAG: YgjP-like metallopeptidase domain-containing protein [Agathobacter rectalis]
MYLRVKDTDGTLSVSAPYGMSDAEIRKFVESKSDWIEQTTRKCLLQDSLRNRNLFAPFMERSCAGSLNAAAEAYRQMGACYGS